MEFVSNTLDESRYFDWLTFFSFSWICKNRRLFAKARKKAANNHSIEGKKAESFKAALQAAFQTA